MCTNPLIIVYDKGGAVEVYGECFKLIGLFCLLLLHVSIIFLNLQPPNVIQKYKEWARSPCNGNHFSSIVGFILFHRIFKNEIQLISWIPHCCQCTGSSMYIYALSSSS